jgi:hypothetical protein
MAVTNTPYLSIAQLANSPTAHVDNALSAFACDTRVCCPGIIQSFDSAKQTVKVKMALREKVFVNQRATNKEIPTLVDVPIVIPRGGNFLLTVPISAGDECLVVFADQCIDSWWQSGGVQSPSKLRRHSLSDGFAILGTVSQPKVVSSYSTSSAQLRNLDGTVIVDVAATGVTVTAPKVAVNTTGDVDVQASGNASVTTAGNASVTASGSVTVSGSSVTLGSATTIDSRVFLNHTHSGVTAGTGVTGKVV